MKIFYIFVFINFNKSAMKLKLRISILLISLFVFLSGFSKSFDNNKIISYLSDTYVSTDTFPSFPGGKESLDAFIDANIQYPSKAKERKIEGVVKVGIEVNEKGKIVKKWIIETPDEELIKESLRLVKKFPLLIPSKIDDKTKLSNGVISILFKLPGSESLTESDFNDEVYIDLDTMPLFPGGETALMKFLTENIRYPVEAQENLIQGSVLCEFTVMKDGSIINIRVLINVNDILAKEAIRVISKMPKWIPGVLNGKNVNCKFYMPVNFKIGN